MLPFSTVIDDKTCEERLWNMKHRGETNFYLCEINRDMVIDATYKGNKSRYINHSCCPNTEMQKWLTTNCFIHMMFVAIFGILSKHGLIEELGPSSNKCIFFFSILRIIDGETRIGIFATSDIQKGEHLTYDYQYEHFHVSLLTPFLLNYIFCIDIYAFGKFWRCWSLRNYASMTGWLFYVSNYIVGLLHLVHIKIAIEVLLSASVSWVSDLPSLNFL